MSEDPSISKSWMRVITARFHVSHQNSRVSVSSPFSRGIPSWTINLPSCRHSLDVKTGTRLEWLLNRNIGKVSKKKQSQFGLWSYITQAKCLVLKYVHLICLRVISINFILEPCSLSTGWDDYLVPFFTTREVLGLFTNDRSMLKRFIPL